MTEAKSAIAEGLDAEAKLLPLLPQNPTGLRFEERRAAAQRQVCSGSGFRVQGLGCLGQLLDSPLLRAEKIVKV